MITSTLLALTLQAAPAASVPDGPAQMPPMPIAEKQIEQADAQLFYAAFEGCAPDVVEGYLLPEYRMIHDQGGLVANSRDDFVGVIRSNCADRAPGGKNEGYKNRRSVVPGTRVFRKMGKWGVVENGDHVFFELRERPAGALGADDPGGPDWVLVGGASYTHVWQWMASEGRFQLSESISYDHGAALPYPPE